MEFILGLIDDVIGMEVEEVGIVELMGGLGQEVEIGVGVVDLGERGGYIRFIGKRERVV